MTQEQVTVEAEIFTVEQVANFLQVKPITVLRKIRAGKIEAFQTNGDSGPYRITKDARDRYMSDSTKMVEVQ